MSLEPGTKPGEGAFVPNAAIVHLYRGEIARSDLWRSRLDTTTNWAVTTTAATMSYGLSSTGNSHVVLLVGIVMVTTFLTLEARRYRYYDLWIRRVRLLEGGYWAPLLRNEAGDPDAFSELALDLSRPQLRLSWFSALAARLNRAYSALLMLLLMGWFVKLYGHAVPPRSLQDFVSRAHVGAINGMVVMAFVVAYGLATLSLVVTAWFTEPPRGEFRGRPSPGNHSLWEVFARPYRVRAPPPHEPTNSIPRSRIDDSLQ